MVPKALEETATTWEKKLIKATAVALMEGAQNMWGARNDTVIALCS